MTESREKRNDSGLYLGCMLTRDKLYDGTKVNTVTYNMEGLLKLPSEKYLDIIGQDKKLKKVNAPSLPCPRRERYKMSVICKHI